MGFKSTHKWARISPRKAGLVMSMIRGKGVEEAMEILDFSHRRASKLIRKVVHSAVANADEQEANMDALYIADARADQGPVLKRIFTRARGAMDIMRKPTCHLIIEVEERQE